MSDTMADVKRGMQDMEVQDVSAVGDLPAMRELFCIITNEKGQPTTTGPGSTAFLNFDAALRHESAKQLAKELELSPWVIDRPSPELIETIHRTLRTKDESGKRLGDSLCRSVLVVFFMICNDNIKSPVWPTEMNLLEVRLALNVVQRAAKTYVAANDADMRFTHWANKKFYNSMLRLTEVLTERMAQHAKTCKEDLIDGLLKELPCPSDASSLQKFADKVVAGNRFLYNVSRVKTMVQACYKLRKKIDQDELVLKQGKPDDGAYYGEYDGVDNGEVKGEANSGSDRDHNKKHDRENGRVEVAVVNGGEH